MVCTSPKIVSYTVDPVTNKKSIFFSKGLAQAFLEGRFVDADDVMRLNCGQCVNCRLARSREWATRCVNESRMHEQNCFITLTYDDENLPVRKSLELDDIQSFVKRLKYKFRDRKIRQLYSGEYGDLTFRPHYHAILFGIDFSHDRKLWKIKDGFRYYNSQSLSELWTFGNAVIGDFCFDTAAYVARYCMKKVNGVRAHAHYRRVDESGDEYFLKSEFAHASNRPGIGAKWFERYGKTDVLAYDRVCVDRGDNRGYSKPPRYYDKLFERQDPEAYAAMKKQRVIDASDNSDDSFRRLQARAECTRLRIQSLVRDVE